MVCFCSPQSAARQGNRLQMNVYESRGTTGRVPGPVPGPGLSQMKSGSLTEPKKGFRPPQHCPSLAQAVSQKVQAAVPEEGLVRIPDLLFSLHTQIQTTPFPWKPASEMRHRTGVADDLKEPLSPWFPFRFLFQIQFNDNVKE